MQILRERCAISMVNAELCEILLIEDAVKFCSPEF
jgi:hypothetical protein